MLSSGIRKTKSAPKPKLPHRTDSSRAKPALHQRFWPSWRRPWVSLIASLVVFILLVVWVAWPRQGDYVLRSNGFTYHLEAAITAQEQIKGLGGRVHMAQHKGMIFVYDQSAPNRCFWMKDMRFSLDIIWVDASKKVTHIEHSVLPSSYPADFCPQGASQYVIELTAGEAKRAGIRPGQHLEF